ncbi:hypothetical protein BH780_gp150 [Bacillus phage Eldridge]|uniref:Uncharacterized protein n=1 Tax=Bacillus phage Eldridge TaxID=1776293 RepID=A0A0Y0ATG8_9CAUD|nr:hypothetical protein BH780_gp150 [Bacillus phage Eldridge]AMB18733.1 hypothetical protein Eldridge_0153 [Bacillus phage Eldridge]
MREWALSILIVLVMCLAVIGLLSLGGFQLVGIVADNAVASVFLVLFLISCVFGVHEVTFEGGK